MSENDLIHDLIAPRPRKAFAGRCGYCGCRTHGAACPAHRDLVQLEADPMQKTEPAAPHAKSATGSIRKEA